MPETPLHPAVVHVPLGLAFVLPLLVLWFAAAVWRGRTARGSWVLIVVLNALVLGGGFVASNTGERDEERVEKIVGHDRVEEHEEAGKQFLWGSGVALAAALLTLAVPAGVAMRWAAVAATATSVALAGLAFRAGHSGGELVYVHGAAAAHVATPPGGATPEVEERDGD